MQQELHARCPGRSLDHSIGRHLHDHRHREAERLRRLEVDHQLQLGRLLEWQIGRFRALEYLTDIEARYSEYLTPTGAIAHQPAGLREVTTPVFWANIVGFAGMGQTCLPSVRCPVYSVTLFRALVQGAQASDRLVAPGARGRGASGVVLRPTQ